MAVKNGTPFCACVYGKITDRFLSVSHQLSVVLFVCRSDAESLLQRSGHRIPGFHGKLGPITPEQRQPFETILGKVSFSII